MSGDTTHLTGDDIGGALGADIGGTFTDFVFLDARGQIRIHKRLTTPHDPSETVLAGLRELGVPDNADIVHGSTIATNALLERRGACTALITTAGFVDVLAIGRQNRPQLYALEPQRPAPLIPAERRLGARERVTAEGHVLRALDAIGIAELCEQLVAANEPGAPIESVAVCLLYSFLHPEHERELGARLRAKGYSVSLSSEILPEHREYERTATTVINAYVAPLMQRYLTRLADGLAGRRLRVMQSNGGVIGAQVAGEQAARTVLSGPAGGVVSAYHIARLAGHERVITFDMGGTSTDVCLCDGGIPHTSESEIAGLPLRLPITDLHTVGAGGGSLARVDAGGALRVGPESAGARPGPACYGMGGTQATVTDANLVLGRLAADYFLGGRMQLDLRAARNALRDLAASLGFTQVAHAPQALSGAAWGVLQVANAAMERAVRRVSVERGIDPRPFTLVAFGGAGPLHACELADTLGMRHVLIPRWPGVLSALGMLVADVVRDTAQVVLRKASETNWFDLRTYFTPLVAQLTTLLRADGIAPQEISFKYALDMRYSGQAYELTVPVEPGSDFQQDFHLLHNRRYGYAHPDAALEIVTLRVTASGRTRKPLFEEANFSASDPALARMGVRSVFFADPTPRALDTPLYTRERLLPGNVINGPAVIVQFDATTVVPPGWRAEVDVYRNLSIKHG